MYQDLVCHSEKLKYMNSQKSSAHLLNGDSRSSEKMAAKFMKRDTFIQKVIFEQIFHF